MPPSYFNEIRRLLDQVESTQAQAVRAAAELIAESFAAGGIWHLFGTGHGHILAEELFYRAGGLFKINAILEPGLMLHDGALASSELERLPGYARIVLSKHTLNAGDVLLVASNSGLNAVPIEAALVAQQLGLKVIALTSLAHSQSVPARHPSGKKLYELADIVLDNCGRRGDAALDLPGLEGAVGPTSTTIGAAILHWLEVEVIRSLQRRGITPGIVTSANVPGGDERNRQAFLQMQGRARSL